MFVAFLDIVADASATTGGALLAVDDAALRTLDERERNYERIDVTTDVEGRPPGTVWAYRGSAAGRARLARGVREGRAVVDVAYGRRSARGWPRSGVDDDGVDPASLPLMRLERVELPA